MQLTAKNEAPSAPLSLLIMGGSQLRSGAYLKGFAFLFIQIVFIYFAIDLFTAIKGLITLGEVARRVRASTLSKVITRSLCW